MKKLLILLLVSISLFSYAQSFQITDPRGTPYSDGETISATITEEDLDDFGEFVTNIMVKNLTDVELDVRTLRTNISLVDGMKAYVCFGVCDDTGENIAMDYTIYEGEQMEYALHLLPNGNIGLCQFKLEFMTSEDQMTLYLDINIKPLGINENGSVTASLSAYPNPTPANSFINVSYTLADNYNNRLVIKNIVGATVMNLPLNPSQNNISIDATALKAGVYFYAIENDNTISIAKKLIVK
ncbi:MAG: T9SS type A sorting domain-containing protein [Bacteroidales bacterium]|jgi:hypothetical protein|nr:T9SS type A sorting domain-containing protein [Bacteroidales bacterium]